MQTPPRPLAAAGAGAGPASGAAAGAGAGSGGRPRAAGAGRAAAGAGAGRARGPGAAAGAAGGAGSPAPAREGPAAGAGGPGEGLAGRPLLSALRSVTPARVASACDLHCGLTRAWTAARRRGRSGGGCAEPAHARRWPAGQGLGRPHTKGSRAPRPPPASILSFLDHVHGGRPRRSAAHSAVHPAPNLCGGAGQASGAVPTRCCFFLTSAS